MDTSNSTTFFPIQPTPSQISIVDIFFPGFGTVFSSMQHIVAGNLDIYVRLLGFCGMIIFLVRDPAITVKLRLTVKKASTVTVPHHDEAYDMLLAWISTQPFADEVQSSLASVGPRQRRVFACDNSSEYKKKTLTYAPWNGSFIFWYKNHLLQFSCRVKEGPFNSREELRLSCIGRSPKIAKELLEEGRAEYLKRLQKKTSVFEHENGEWKKVVSRDMRPISTVIMNEGDKKALVEDIQDFLSEETRNWYARRGIQYKRGFLWHGPPGTGKSSFSFSIAGQFELDIYVLSIPKVDDGEITSLFAKLPPHCIVLLEDVDAVGTARTERPETPKSLGDSSTVSEGGKSPGQLSMSGLLNALDGVSSAEGRVLIMTTNHIDKLDKALIRSGRVDQKVLFPLADEDLTLRLFCTMYEPLDGNQDAAKKDDEEHKTIERLAKEFASKIPSDEFSPAEIQELLVKNKHSPANAVASVEEWMVNVRKERNNLRREDSWVHSDSA
ncbi:putative mitochondrial chaperone BCS1-B [Talaromyces islandicus]|uniref:Putative mitochondrial chaperone BCS1-B n=1 Tax=Talaromyces islandicus TaxID=28573 RepID=A0A0U1MB85_TALIS|nr:putative mitochondrial chaperone BCS1-B [Talaromyces islandicus]